MSLFDLSGTVLAFATGTYDVARADPGTYDVNGLVVDDPTVDTVAVPAMIVPLVGGKQLERLPEGLRSRDAIEVFTAVALQASAPEQRPDVITFNGRAYQVDVVDDWTAAGNFYHSLATRIP
jgi:hypothetical protein